MFGKATDGNRFLELRLVTIAHRGTRMSVTDAPEPLAPPGELSYFEALLPLVVLAVLVAGSVALFGLDAMAGPLQVAMSLAAMTASLIVLRKGHAWDAVSEASRRGVSSVVTAIFILLAVGGLIGTWNLAGTIPTLVYYGSSSSIPTGSTSRASSLAR